VARATEGAAESRPAKLLGFNTSPNRENAETTVPPTSTRIRISFVIDSSGGSEFALFGALAEKT
jgi:hypothetical protein